MLFEKCSPEIQGKIGEWIEILDPHKTGDEEIPIRKEGKIITISVPISGGEVVVKFDPQKLS